MVRHWVGPKTFSRVVRREPQLRARDSPLEIDEGGTAPVLDHSGRRRDPGRQQGATSGRADPLGCPGHLEGGRHLDGPAERGKPIRDRRLDELERGAADERRQDLDPDDAVAGADLEPVDDPEVDNGQHRELRVHHLGQRAADGVEVDGSGGVGIVGSAGVGAVTPARSRAMPIWVPASLTRSLRGRRVGPR